MLRFQYDSEVEGGPTEQHTTDKGVTRKEQLIKESAQAMKDVMNVWR